MFDDNQTPATSSTDDALQASLPDPIPDGTLSGGTSSVTNTPPADAPPFGASASSDDKPADSTTDTPPSAPTTDTVVTPSPSPTATAPTADDLLTIKQEALQQLSPLVGHLDQSPEEKFRTTMMMIQAADDQSLLKSAYEAAQQITDEKVRAQALLDVVNEINYFTQQSN